jgi:ABC-type sugar transport system ATPase subunit
MPWLLEMKNITKTFGAVKAVDNVSLRLNPAKWSRCAAKTVRANRR